MVERVEYGTDGNLYALSVTNGKELERGGSRMNEAEEYANQKIKEKLNQIIKEGEEQMRSTKGVKPVLLRFYEMGERTILNLVKLHLMELEEK